MRLLNNNKEIKQYLKLHFHEEDGHSMDDSDMKDFLTLVNDIITRLFSL